MGYCIVGVTGPRNRASMSGGQRANIRNPDRSFPAIRQREEAVSDKTIEFTSENFTAEVLESDTPVLVDFWAVWCAPCRMVAPVVEEMADTYAGKVKVGKLNVDEHGDIATRYNVRGIPTLLLFNNGQVQEQIVGAVPRDTVATLLDKATKAHA
jgi:thioredoxin 1